MIKVLACLEKEWSSKVAGEFLLKIDHRLHQLSAQPFLGAPSQRIKDVRGILITKHNRLYYKVKGRKLIVLDMYDTRMNPIKKKY